MNIMLDLETLSLRPDACIVAIGATTFSDDGSSLDDPASSQDRWHFYEVIDAGSAQRSGGRIDASTVQWWAQQNERARAAIFAADMARVSLEDALKGFAAFCARLTEPKVWGNGASFDCVVLRQSYERLGMEAPWTYRNEACYRTLKNLRTDIAFEPGGTKHHALDDAIAQARHAERILAALRVAR